MPAEVTFVTADLNLCRCPDEPRAAISVSRAGRPGATAFRMIIWKVPVTLANIQDLYRHWPGSISFCWERQDDSPGFQKSIGAIGGIVSTATYGRHFSLRHTPRLALGASNQILELTSRKAVLVEFEGRAPGHHSLIFLVAHHRNS